MTDTTWGRAPQETGGGWERQVEAEALAAGSTIKGEVTTARAPPAGKGGRKPQGVRARGEVGSHDDWTEGKSISQKG